jgi:TonB family protein
MKQTLITMLLLLAMLSCGQQSRAPAAKTESEYARLFPMKVDGKWGYVDRTGKLAVNPLYDQADDFSDGMGRVRIGSKFGFVRADGSLAVTPQFDSVWRFSEGLAGVKANGKWGYIDRTGKLAVSPRFDHAEGFSEGLALVEQGGKLGYADKAGEIVITPQFDCGMTFSQGLAPVEVAGRWGYVNKVGEYIINPQFGLALPFSESLAVIQIGDLLAADCRWAYIDMSGMVVISRTGMDFSEGLAATPDEDKWGYVDKTGKYVISPQFDAAQDFSEGLACVRIGDESTGRWGYIGREGKFTINPRFDSASSFTGGVARVVVGDEMGYIDKTGKYVWREESKPAPEEARTPSAGTTRTEGDEIPVVPFWKVDKKPQPVNIPVPTYPDVARTAGIEGQAVVEALADIDGSVAQARILKPSGNAALDSSAVDAASRSTFTPAKQRGKAVQVWVSIPFRFTLQ